MRIKANPSAAFAMLYVAVSSSGNAYPQSFNAEPQGALESESFLTIQVRRVDSTDFAASVSYATGTNGTARAGLDYIPVSGKIVFHPGESFAHFTIPLLDDGFLEGPETVEILLSDPSTGERVNEYTFARIFDDEVPANLDYSFNPPFSRWPEIGEVLVQPDSKILVAGRELFVDSNQVGLIRLDSNGTIDRSFRFSMKEPVDNLWLAPGGKILVVTSTDTRSYVRLLLPDGSQDPSFHAPPELGTSCWPALVQDDGKIVLWSLSVGQADERRLRRIYADGSVDTGFDHNVEDLYPIRQVAAQGGKLLVLYGDEQRTLLRLNSDGSRDSTFQNITGALVGLFPESDSRILIFGVADDIGGTKMRLIIPLDRDGNEDFTLFPFYRTYLGLPVAEIAGFHYFWSEAGELLRVSLDGPRTGPLLEDGRDTKFGVRLSNRFSEWGAGPFPVAKHQGALLVWGVSDINSSSRALARILLDDKAPTSAFSFKNHDSYFCTEPVSFANEADGVATIVIRRVGDLGTTATVEYTTVDGTAVAGKHYLASSGTATFMPLEFEKAINVPLLQDGVFSGMPEFFVVLGSSSVPTALERALRVVIRDREFGMVPGLLLSRFDGSSQMEFDVTGSYEKATIERSSDLKAWSFAPAGNFGWTLRPKGGPPTVQISANDRAVTFRARQD